MRNMILAAGVAALAISVPAAAKPDRDGKGRGAQASKFERGGGKASFAQRSERRSERAQKALGKRAERVEKAREKRAERRQEARAERRRDLRELRAERREDARERFAFNRDRNRNRDRIRFHEGNKWGGYSCPPGLWKKTPRCEPPGQVGRDRFDDDDRIILGRRLPAAYQNYYVPNRYQSFYPNTRGDDYFRYANGYVYEIDRNTGLVENMIPLLDNGYGVGQMLPASYSAYNVPYQYRSSFYDTPNAAYRYAPGAIYQVDPTTQLITAVASLLAPGLGIGQQLPSAYSAYNVPMGYRSQYYDTPDSMYRYANNNIYRVDPTTQLITAIVASII